MLRVINGVAFVASGFSYQHIILDAGMVDWQSHRRAESRLNDNVVQVTA